MMGGGLGQTMMTGMAFGAGSAVAHKAVDSMMGGGSHGGQQQAPQQSEQQQQMSGQPMGQQNEFGNEQHFQQEQPCQSFNMNFIQCLKQNSTEVGMCQEYMNMLQQCEKDNFSKFN